MAITVNSASIVATAQSYPVGRLVWIELDVGIQAGDKAVSLTDILNVAYSAATSVTGTMIEVFDRGGTDLKLNGGAVYVVPYIDVNTNSISFRDSTTGALLSEVAVTANVQFTIAFVQA